MQVQRVFFPSMWYCKSYFYKTIEKKVCRTCICMCVRVPDYQYWWHKVQQKQLGSRPLSERCNEAHRSSVVTYEVGQQHIRNSAVESLELSTYCLTSMIVIATIHQKRKVRDAWMWLSRLLSWTNSMIEFGPVLHPDGNLCILNYCTGTSAVIMNVYWERCRMWYCGSEFRHRKWSIIQSEILLITHTSASEYTHVNWTAITEFYS